MQIGDCANVGCCEVIPPSDILIVDGIFVLKLLKPLKILHFWDRPNTWELEMIICSESSMWQISNFSCRGFAYILYNEKVELFVCLSWILFFL